MQQMNLRTTLNQQIHAPAHIMDFLNRYEQLCDEFGLCVVSQDGTVQVGALDEGYFGIESCTADALHSGDVIEPWKPTGAKAVKVR
jgi:hypothetical protein